MAVSPNGHIAVVYSAGASYVLRRGKPGGALGRPQAIPGSAQIETAGPPPQVAVNDRGDAAIAWDALQDVAPEDDPEDCCGFVVATTAPAGRGPDPPQAMSVADYDGAETHNARIAIGPTGRAVLTYDLDCAPVLRVARRGGTFGSPVRIRGKVTACGTQTTQPAALANGDALLTYAWDTGHTTRLSRLRVSARGRVSRHEVGRGPGAAFLNPQATTSTMGRTTVAFGRERAHHRDQARLGVIGAHGGPFATRLIGSRADETAFLLAGAPNGRGAYLLNRRGLPLEIAGRNGRPGHRFGLGRHAYLSDPALAVSGHGVAIVTGSDPNRLALRIGRGPRQLRHAHTLRCRCSDSFGPVAPAGIDERGRAVVVYSDGDAARLVRYR